MDFEIARNNMVDNQIRTNKVTDPLVISALRSVPREKFVPDNKKLTAFIDNDIEVSTGRYLMEPMVFARLIQLAEIQRSDVVLDVGCATGYSTAVLANMASSVVALESSPELAAKATVTLQDLDVENAVVVEGALEEGLSKQGPYDVIFINGSVDRIPDGLRTQLSEGGRIVTVIRDKGTGRATLMTRRAGAFGHRTDFDANIEPLPGLVLAPEFVF